MALERPKLTKNRKIEKSFEDLLTGLSDESDDDIDDLVNFENLPEMCSEDTLIAIARTNKPYTHASSMDDSLRMSDFVAEKEDFKFEPSDTQAENNRDSDILACNNNFISKQSEYEEDKVHCDKVIDFHVATTTDTETKNLFEFEYADVDDKQSDNLIDWDDKVTEDRNVRDCLDDDYYTDLIDNEDENDKYEEGNGREEDGGRDDGGREDGGMEDGGMEDGGREDGGMEDEGREDGGMEDSEKEDNNVDLVITVECCDNTVDMDQNTEHISNELKRDESIDLDALVQDNLQLDVDMGKQKTALRKRGSLAKRRKPSRSSIHSMGEANEDSHYIDSTEPKPEIQNGFTNEEDVFSPQNLSNDKDVPSPPAKKPLPGMVALPGLGMPMPVPRRRTRGSSPSDSDLTPDDQSKKDLTSVGVKLPISSTDFQNQSDNNSSVLRKTADRESLKSPVANAIQFEKPKLKAVSRAECDKTDSDKFGSSSFDMPSLKQVQKAPTKSRGLSGNDSEDIDSRHVFQTPKLRKVEDVPTDSLQFITGRTGESEDSDNVSSNINISYDFQTPKLKKVETNDSDIKISLGHNIEESSTDNTNYGIYFEKPQLRNVPKPTETLRNIYQEKYQIEMPDLKNVPKIELELKSPPISDSENKFNVPHLKSVQKGGRGTDNQEKEEGVFRIPTLKSTPLPQRREQPKSPEAKTFDVPALRRTPRVKQDSENFEMEKPATGIFEKPKLKSARSLQQDMDDSSSNDSDIKHRFEMPTLRNTPAKIETSIQRSDSAKSDSDKPSWLQDTKLRPSVDRVDEKPSWLSDSKEIQDAKENKSLESTPRKSSIPQQEATDIAVNGHRTSSRNRLTSSGSNHDGDDLKIKRTANRDHYVPSWLKTTDLREKSPSTPNLVFVTPTKDTSEVPQWKRELREKRKERKDSDTGFSTKRTESAAEKGLPPWKVELGQKKMRQTPVKVQETKRAEPEWKKAADDKRQRLRNSGLLTVLKS